MTQQRSRILDYLLDAHHHVGMEEIYQDLKPQGIGKVTVDALAKLDYPVVMGSVLVAATFFILINILADILYGVVDPRVRIG